MTAPKPATALDLPYYAGTVNGSPHAVQYVNSGGVVSDAAFCDTAERAAYIVHAAKLWIGKSKRYTIKGI